MKRFARILAILLTVWAFFTITNTNNLEFSLPGLHRLYERVDFIHTSMMAMVGVLFLMGGAFCIMASYFFELVGSSGLKYASALMIFGAGLVATNYYVLVSPNDPSKTLLTKPLSRGSEFLAKRALR